MNDMDGFVKKYITRKIHKAIQDIQNELLHADIIGIGEYKHSDTISWVWRFAIVQFLVQQGYTLHIFCENSDAMLQNGHNGQNGQNRNLSQLNGNAHLWTWILKYVMFIQFQPFMIPWSESSKWHFNMTRAFSEFPDHQVYFH